MKFKGKVKKQKKKFTFKPMIERAQKLDKVVLILVFALFGIGLLMIYSITSISIYNGAADDTLFFVKKTVVSGVIGIVGMIFLALIPYNVLKFFAFLATVLCPPILIFTLIFGKGSGASNVRSWIKIGPLSIQPAEFVKLGVILALAWFITYSIKQNKYHLRSFKNIGTIENFQGFLVNGIKYLSNSFLRVLLYLGFCTGLVLIQPDLGSALIIFGIGVIIFMCSGIDFKVIMTLIGMALLIIIPLILSLKDYQMDRFYIWWDPFNHDNGLQNVMGYTAIALGGLFGVGIGNSTQKYGYVIEPHTDMISTILIEELGVVTILLIMVAYLVIVARCFLTAFKCKDLFGSLVCIGVGAMFLLQPVINLGGASGTIPLTGVTLPFIGYGGTSLMVLFFTIGVYLNVRIEMLSKLKTEQSNATVTELLKTNIIPFK